MIFNLFIFSQPRRALCSIGIVNFVFIVITITSSRGIIKNIKKGKILREGFFFGGGGGGGIIQEMTATATF